MVYNCFMKIKGSLSSSWMNSWLSPLAKRVFMPNHSYENAPVHSFSWKSSHFHVKCFARAFVLKRGKKQRSISNIPPNGMLVHPRVTCTMYLALLNLPVLISPPEWKEAARVKCLAQEHNTMLPARAQGQTAQNRKEIKIKWQVVYTDSL